MADYNYQVGDIWLPDSGNMAPQRVLHVHRAAGTRTWVTCEQLQNPPNVYTWVQQGTGPARCGTPTLTRKVDHPHWAYLKGAWYDQSKPVRLEPLPILDRVEQLFEEMTGGTWSHDNEGDYIWSGDEKEPCRASVFETRGTGTGEPQEKNALGVIMLANCRMEILAVVRAARTADCERGGPATVVEERLAAALATLEAKLTEHLEKS